MFEAVDDDRIISPCVADGVEEILHADGLVGGAVSIGAYVAAAQPAGPANSVGFVVDLEDDAAAVGEGVGDWAQNTLE